jgi:ribosome-interacting GTPase 1
MNINIEIEIEDIAQQICENIDYDEAVAIIKKIDLHFADVDFTSDLMDYLYDSMLKEGIEWHRSGMVDLEED